MGRSVPEWMNSSLWSSYDERHLAKHSSSTSPRDDSIRPSDPRPPRKRPPSPPLPVSAPSASSSTTRASRSDRPGDPAGSSAPARDDSARRARFLAELSKRVIDVGELRRLAVHGVPDSCGIRPVIWKSELTRRLERFSSAVENENAKLERKGLLPRSKISNGEHPLSLRKISLWKKYFQDLEFIEQVDSDVKRTHPDMPFFSGDSPASMSNQEAMKSLKCVFMVFAKLNPGIRYVQGMNEVLTPIFYTFRTDPDGENAAQVEPDFFCFVELISGFRDHFCQQLDNSIYENLCYNDETDRNFEET